MADFHSYTITATVKVVVPADASGNAATFDLNNLPAALRVAVQAVPTLSKASVSLPVVATSAATPVTV